MKEEELQQSVTGKVEEENTDYITAIKELKQNSVDRSKYDQVVAEKKALLDALVNGEEIEVAKEPSRSVEELRKEMFSGNQITNLQFAKDALELRKALIAKGERDPFLPTSRSYIPVEEDIEGAKRLADVLQECIDYAEGDNNVFTNELQRHMVDTGINKRK